MVEWYFWRSRGGPPGISPRGPFLVRNGPTTKCDPPGGLQRSSLRTALLRTTGWARQLDAPEGGGGRRPVNVPESAMMQIPDVAGLTLKDQIF